MPTKHYFFTAQSGAALSSKPGAAGGYASQTLDYVPGTSIRGAVARLYLRRPGKNPTSDEFLSLFHSDDVVFGDAVPLGANVIPLSAHTRKNSKGFRQDVGVAGGVSDLLLFPERRPKDEVVVAMSGWYVKDHGAYRKASACTAISAHTAHNSGTKAREEAGLFAREYIEDEQSFECVIKTDADGIIEDLLKPPGCLLVGQAKSRGWGELAVSTVFSADNPPLPPASVIERIARFQLGYSEDSKCGETDELLSLTEANENKLRFSLTLFSNAIVLDPWLRPQSMIYEDLLMAALKGAGANIEANSPTLLNAFSRVTQVHGWNAAHKLPKPVDWAISMGSAFLYEIGVKNKTELDCIVNALWRLQCGGIGVRRNEGFGSLRVCDQFHLEVNEWQ